MNRAAKPVIPFGLAGHLRAFCKEESSAACSEQEGFDGLGGTGLDDPLRWRHGRILIVQRSVPVFRAHTITRFGFFTKIGGARALPVGSGLWRRTKGQCPGYCGPHCCRSAWWTSLAGGA